MLAKLNNGSGKAQRGKLGIQIAGSDGELSGFDAIAKGEGRQLIKINLPGTRAGSLQRELLIALLKTETVEVLSMISNGVGAWRPKGQSPALTLDPGRPAKLNCHDLARRIK